MVDDRLGLDAVEHLLGLGGRLRAVDGEGFECDAAGTAALAVL